jgi:hypothetical protein
MMKVSREAPMILSDIIESYLTIFICTDDSKKRDLFLSFLFGFTTEI